MKVFQKKRPKRTRILIGALVLIVLVLFIFRPENPQLVDTTTETFPAVTLISVRDASLNQTPLPTIGTITSQSEATIRTEGSGRITSVYRDTGNFVTAGSVIAEIENRPA